MKTLLERLGEGEILICDGAMGTQLQAAGWRPGKCPELWCITHPNEVRSIHREYQEAGSDIVECNSFGGTHYKLKHFEIEGRVAEINRAAASLAREIAEGFQHVLGSVGPTGVFIEPYGSETEENVYAAFKEQIMALKQGGADSVIIETMTGVEEARLAIKAAKENTDLTVIASFSFDPQKNGGYASMMGVTPETFAEAALEAGADILGANCGTGPDAMIEIVGLLRDKAGETPILAMPNAGMPVLENGQTVFKESPDEMAAKAPKLVDAGARIIGGCCGTTPEHIAAMKRAVRG